MIIIRKKSDPDYETFLYDEDPIMVNGTEIGEIKVKKSTGELITVYTKYVEPDEPTVYNINVETESQPIYKDGYWSISVETTTGIILGTVGIEAPDTFTDTLPTITFHAYIEPIDDNSYTIRVKQKGETIYTHELTYNSGGNLHAGATGEGTYTVDSNKLTWADIIIEIY